MSDSATNAFAARLNRVAIDLILPAGLDVKAAVVLAEAMVAVGVGQAATIAVAALERDAWTSDAESLVRDMLAEHGIDVPTPHDEETEYQALLLAFGYWDLPLYNFEGPFYVRIPAWDDQGPLDRTLVTILDRRDHETTPEARSAIEQDMRTAVRLHLDAK